MQKKAFLNLAALTVGSLMLPTLVSADPGGGNSAAPDLTHGAAMDIRSIFNDNTDGPSCFKYAELTIKDVDFTDNADFQLSNRFAEDFTFQFCTDRDIRFKTGFSEQGRMVVHLTTGECYVGEAPVWAFGVECKIKYNPNKFGGCQCQGAISFPAVNTAGIDEQNSNIIPDIEGKFVVGKSGIMDNSFPVENKNILDAFATLVSPVLQENSCPEIKNYRVLDGNYVKLASCVAGELKPACCCDLVASGSLSKQYTCRDAMLLPDQTCGTATTLKRTPPQSGVCSELNTTFSTNYNAKESGFTIGDKKLFEEAKKLNRLGSITFNDLIGRVVKGLMAFMGMILFVLYIYAGLMWMLAAGNDEQITKSKNILVWSTLGVAVMLGSYVIVQFLFRDALKLF